MLLKSSVNFRSAGILQSQIRTKSTVAEPAAEEVKAKKGPSVIIRTLPSIKSDDYQYIQRSKVPTLHFQKSLPRLPIPELDKTCQRYLSAQKPLLSDDAFEKTKKLTEEFQASEGKKLHEELLKRDASNKHTSYISKPWFDMYLTDRTPLPLNYNPVLVFSNGKNKELNSQLVRATNMVVSSLRFLKSLRAGILAPEVFHLNPKKSDTNLFRTVTKLLPPSLSWYGAYMFNAYPLDMSQYSSLFNSTRIPQIGRDILQKDEKARHLLVLRNGHFFTVDVLDSAGDILAPEDILTCLNYILQKDLKTNTESLGLLTTENRDSWAKSRQHITQLSQVNVDSLKAIDTALFVLCLDDVSVGMEREKIMRNFLHGDGINRWYDKSFSLILAKDGTAAVNFEHSWGDGVAVLRYFTDILKDSTENPFVDVNTKPVNINPEELVKQLTFQLDDKAKNDVKTAKENFDAVCKSLAIDILEYHDLGKKDCKKAQVSPDAVMQLAFQVAYHKVFGNFVATYESCSTAAFKHGRTETVRPCTSATKEFALKFNGKNKPSKGDLIEMMKKCSAIHGNLTKEAAMGQGFDRHLFGLRHTSSEINHPLPEFFKDEAYQRINQNILSTSTLSSEAVMMGGFGPVVPDGFGVGYSILDEFAGSVVTSYPAKRKGADFAEALLLTLKEFKDVLKSK